MTQHIHQLDRFGCAVACMAMVRGVPYEAVRADMRDVGRGHDFMSWQDYLARHGFAAQMAWHTDQISQKKRDPWPLQPWADLHLCCVDAGCGSASHLVVMLTDGTVLDPASEGPRRLTDYSSVAYMAAIHHVAGGTGHLAGQGESLAWRVGNHYGIHVYAGDRPVATFHSAEDAARAVAAVYAAPAPSRPANREEIARALARHRILHNQFTWNPREPLSDESLKRAEDNAWKDWLGFADAVLALRDAPRNGGDGTDSGTVEHHSV